MHAARRQAHWDHDTGAARTIFRTPRAEIALVLVALSVCSTAVAQSSVPCTAIVNDAERLACYDRALRPDVAPAAERPAVPAAPAREPAPSTARRPDPEPRNGAAPAPAAPPPAAAAPTPSRVQPYAAPEVRSVVVVDVRTLPGRPSTFTTGGGEHWIQTDNQRPRFPDAPFDAEIKPGAMGSFFLVPKDRGRAIRVRHAE